MLFSSIGLFFNQRPWLISIILLIVLSFWLSLGSANDKDSRNSDKAAQSVPLAKVVYQTFHAQPTFKQLDLYGRTAPDKQAHLGAEIAGKVVRLAIKQGDSVKKGQLIVQLDKGDLSIQLARAKAQLLLRQKEFDASKSLKSRGLQGEVAFTSSQAGLLEAKALVSNAKLLLSKTEVRAPFDGVIESLIVELGDFVAIGDPIASIIDLNPLIISADVSEQHILQLKPQQSADVHLLNHDNIVGQLRYISRLSSPATNTFAIEIEIDNPNQTFPAGVSAQVMLSLAAKQAIKVTPAMLALDESGNLGVKTLQNNRVKFVPIQLVKAEQDGVWLTGLGKSVDIIVTGQGFVRDGDEVLAQKATVSTSSATTSKTDALSNK